jgi:hypothetical protein
MQAEHSILPMHGLRYCMLKTIVAVTWPLLRYLIGGQSAVRNFHDTVRAG